MERACPLELLGRGAGPADMTRTRGASALASVVRSAEGRLVMSLRRFFLTRPRARKVRGDETAGGRGRDQVCAPYEVFF